MQPGRELDALVAEKVMGLGPYLGKFTTTLNCGHEMSYQISNPDDRVYIECQCSWTGWISRSGPMPYSVDIASAWEVVEKMKRLTEINGKTFSTRDPWQKFCHDLVGFDTDFSEAFWYVNPRTICLAALKAIGIEV